MDPGVEDGRSSNKFRVTRKGSGAYARSDAVARLILFNKPYGVLSQFTDRSTPEARATLSDYNDMPGVYPAGRLDRDSKGLLIMTDDVALQARISSPSIRRAQRKDTGCQSV